jgi:hypothetical protein
VILPHSPYGTDSGVPPACVEDPPEEGWYQIARRSGSEAPHAVRRNPTPPKRNFASVSWVIVTPALYICTGTPPRAASLLGRRRRSGGPLQRRAGMGLPQRSASGACPPQAGAGLPWSGRKKKRKHRYMTKRTHFKQYHTPQPQRFTPKWDGLENHRNSRKTAEDRPRNQRSGRACTVKTIDILGEYQLNRPVLTCDTDNFKQYGRRQS